MDANLQVVLSVAIPTFAVLLSTLSNNARLNDFRNNMDARLKSMDEKFDSRFRAMDDKFDAMDEKFDARFHAIDVRLDAIDDRIADSRDILRAEIRRVEEVVGTRLKHLEDAR